MLVRSMLFASAMLVPVFGAAAQTTQPADGPEQAADEGLADIVVVASKRETNQQQTAIAVTAIQPEDLARSGVTDVSNLSKLAPSLNISSHGNSTLISIRGVSSRDYNELGDPAVSVSIDGIYLQRSNALNASFFDLDRIEVLRGPQGTLYGRNATGGAINIISARPRHVTDAAASVQYGNFDALRAEAMVNAPLTDTLALRVAGVHDSRKGYRDNGPGGRGDEIDSWGGRISLGYDGNQGLTATLIGEVIRQRGVGGVRQGVFYQTDATGAIIDGPPAISDDKNWNLDIKGRTAVDIRAVRGNIAYDFGPATISYTGGFRRAEIDRNEDYDGTAVVRFGFPQISDTRTQSHEVRLTSNGDTRFAYQVGGYYFKEVEDLFAYFDDDSFGPRVPLLIYDYDGAGQGLSVESKAVFAQASYKVLGDLKLEAGLRWSEDQKSRVGAITSYDLGAYFTTGALTGETRTPSIGSAKFDKLTYHMGAEYQLSRQNLLYVKYDTGYKSGGFTETSGYGPETIGSFEIGSKNRFAGNALQLNAAAFHYNYKGQQILQVRNNATTVTNAGRTEVWGVEIEGLYAPTRNDRLDLALSWLDSKFKSFVIDGTYRKAGTVLLPDGNVDLAGNRSVQAPKWSFNGGYEHRFEFAGGSLTARVQTQVQSSSYLSVYNFEASRQKAYSRSDIILTYQLPGDRVAIEGYVRNLEDRRILTGGDPDNAVGAFLYQFAPPRTYGARLSWKL